MYYWVHNDFPLPSLQPFYCLFWFCNSAWVLQEPTMPITQTCTHIQTHTHAHIIAHRRRKTTPGTVFVKSLSLVRCRFCFFSFSFFLLHTSPFPSFLLLSAIPSLFLLYSVFFVSLWLSQSSPGQGRPLCTALAFPLFHLLSSIASDTSHETCRQWWT